VTRPTARTVALGAQLALALAMVLAVVAWRDPDPILRWLIPLLGLGGLALGVLATRWSAGRWALVAVDLWFVLLGMMLTASVSSARVGVIHYDPPPSEIAALERFDHWLDPALQNPITDVFLIAGTLGAVAAIRTRPRRHAGGG
jgi:hypothetical protein